MPNDPMTREALAALVAAMTRGPWSQECDEGELTDRLIARDEYVIHAFDGPHDATGIAALRNNAERLLEIWEERDRLREGLQLIDKATVTASVDYFQHIARAALAGEKP